MIKRSRQKKTSNLPKVFFNEPWMDKLDKRLLYRYWWHKGTPLPLLMDTGIASYVCYKTKFGPLKIIGLSPGATKSARELARMS